VAGYGASQLAALDWLRGEVGRLGVDCQWAERDSYVYVEDPGQRDRLRREADAAAELGLPASYVDDVDLPYPTGGAVRFTGQAQFHPVRWLVALADRIPGDGELGQQSGEFKHAQQLRLRRGQSQPTAGLSGPSRGRDDAVQAGGVAEIHVGEVQQQPHRTSRGQPLQTSIVTVS
jgi:hypothetical protein